MVRIDSEQRFASSLVRVMKLVNLGKRVEN